MLPVTDSNQTGVYDLAGIAHLGGHERVRACKPRCKMGVLN